MLIMRRITWLGFLVLAGQLGCAGSQRVTPTSEQVEGFIGRRVLAMKAITVPMEPMAGTSCLPPCSEFNRIAGFCGEADKATVRDDIKKHGSYSQVHMGELEFDVILEDASLLAQTPKQIAIRLNHHYAAELEKAGWFISTARWRSPGGTDTDRYWVTYTWTDRGSGSHRYTENRLNLDSHFSNEDYKKGFFAVNIAVCVDKASKRAHVVIGGCEAIGL